MYNIDDLEMVSETPHEQLEIETSMDEIITLYNEHDTFVYCTFT